MPDVGCQTVFTDEDERLLDAAGSRAKSTRMLSGHGDEIAEGLDDSVRDHHARTALRLAESLERAAGEPLTDDELGKYAADLGREVWEREQDIAKAMWDAGKALNLSPLQRVAMPLVVCEQGIDDAGHKTHETLELLVGSKIPPDWREEHTLNAIVFVNRHAEAAGPGSYTRGLTFPPAAFAREPDIPRALFLFREPDGSFPSGHRLLHAVAHELAHVNEPKITRVAEAHSLDWVRAATAQEQHVQRCEHSECQYARTSDKELVAQSFAFWVTDSPHCHPLMRGFLEDHLPR